MFRVVKRALHLWAHCQVTSKVLEWCKVSGQTVCPPPSGAQSVGGRWRGGISVDPIRLTTCFLKVGEPNPSFGLCCHKSNGSFFKSLCFWLVRKHEYIHSNKIQFRQYNNSSNLFGPPSRQTGRLLLH